MRVAVDVCHAEIPLPLKTAAGAAHAPTTAAAAAAAAAARFRSSNEGASGVKKGLELKFPLVVAALRYLTALQKTNVALHANTERKELMQVMHKYKY